MTRKQAHLLAYMVILVPAAILLFFGLNFINEYNKEARESYSKVAEMTLDFRNESDLDIENMEVVFITKKSAVITEKISKLAQKGNYIYKRMRDIDTEVISCELFDGRGGKLDLGSVLPNTENKRLIKIKSDSTKEKLNIEVIDVTKPGGN